MRWCGPEVEVEGIVSVKTGGCPEDCHFCSQSGLFPSPVRAAWLDIPSLVEAAKETAATGATEFCIVAAVRGPDERLMAQMREGVKAIQEAVDINVAALARHAHPGAGRRARRHGRPPLQPQPRDGALVLPERRHHAHAGRSAGTPAAWSRAAGMEVCCGGIVGMGETLEQRAEFAAQLAELEPDEVPLNFLNPRPGTPFGDLPVMEGQGRAAHHRGLPAGDAAHDPALRRRPRAHPRRPRHRATACSAASTPSSSATT